MVVKILNGDCREMLKTLPDNSINCVITSPPYYGLRDYGVDNQIGLEQSPDCGAWNKGLEPYIDYEIDDESNEKTPVIAYKRIEEVKTCGKCYVCKMIEVFREVKRVLRDDGTLWLNLGDSYSGSGKGQYKDGEHDPKKKKTDGMKLESCVIPNGLKPKDLIGIPWRVAFALQADGWYLRQDIIWSKNNPMPESVKDRCTKSHEYIFLLSKSKKYYFDSNAIKEPLARPEECNRKTPAVLGGRDKFEQAKKQSRLHSGNEYLGTIDGKRNKRSVWQVNTKPYKGAHFATFPIDLVEPCGLAGCPENGVILDPFGGSGTVGQWCNYHNRNAILIELNPAYIPLIEERINTEPKQVKKKMIESCNTESEIEYTEDFEQLLSIEELETSLEGEEQDSYYNLLLSVPSEHLDMVRKAYWIEKGLKI